MARFEKSIDREKRLRKKAYLEERLRALTEFRDLDFLYTINPQNKNAFLEYLKFLAFTDLSLKTASNIKGNLKLFFTWNKDFNEDRHIRKITQKQATAFFKWMKNEGYTSIRASVVKTDLCDFADYLQYVLGKDQYRHNGESNSWYNYNGQFWKKIIVEQEEEPNIIRKPNCLSFDRERLDVLHVYLKRKKDWMGVIILEYASLGVDILKLKIDDEEFNRQTSYCQNYLSWRTREEVPQGLKDVCIMRNHRTKEFMPMDISTLRAYAKMFSIFLGKEFIIC